MGFLGWIAWLYVRITGRAVITEDDGGVVNESVVDRESVWSTEFVKLNLTQFHQLLKSRGIDLKLVGPKDGFSNMGEAREWTKAFSLKARFSGIVDGSLPKFHNQGVRQALRMKKEYKL